MTPKKWPVARIVKVWLEIFLGVTVFAGVAIGILLLVSPWAFSTGVYPDLWVRVAIGSEAVSTVPLPPEIFPVVPLKIRQSPASGPVTGDLNPWLVRGFGDLRVNTTSWRLYAVFMSGLLATFVITFLVTWKIRSMVKSALAGRAFARENARRLRFVGLVVLAYSGLWPVVNYLIAKATLAQAVIEGIPLTPALRFSVDPVLVGLLVLILAAVFRHGADLEDEQSLTI